VPVLDHSKRLVGIVSLGDLATDARDDRVSGEVLERVSDRAQPDR
jgi:CBS-domain-containing membrane protein